MNLIIRTALEEKQRIGFMLERYGQELIELPKGTISEKKVKDKIYYYLKFREGKKIISKYIGKQEIEMIREQLKKRRHIEAMIRSLQEEQALVEKILGGNT